MAAPAPSSLFVRMVHVWRDLSLRSDVDDIILELLGRFSLERIYSEAGDKGAYQQLVISLLAQLNAIFYIQRLTVPAENIHVGKYLGLLASWEVTIRSIELVLQVVNDARESLWECRRLRDKYLAEFLLSALRLLTLHPRALANQRARDRRERFARIHKALERVFDSYPGDKSFLLLVCKDVTSQLCSDPNAISLPQRLRYELPNLTSELYPLEECLSSQYISDVVSSNGVSDNWLYEFLTLRDISHFIVGASIQYSANQETRQVRLQSSSARSRNAILRALENVRLPPHLSKTNLVATFVATFRTVLPDTLDMAPIDSAELNIDELELDALDSLGARLGERQIVHRVSDGAMMHGVSQVIREIVLQDNPTGHFGTTARPSLYVLNCRDSHIVGGAQLRALDIQVSEDQDVLIAWNQPDSDGSVSRIPPDSTCPVCEEEVTTAREVTLARRTWEILRPLETDADTINVERHLPSHFQMQPPKVDTDDLFSHAHRHHSRLVIPDHRSPDPSPSASQNLLSPQSPGHIQFNPEQVFSEASTYINRSDRGRERDQAQESTFGVSHPLTNIETKRSSHEFLPRRKSEPPTEKPKSRWRLFGSTRKSTAPAGTSGDSSSLSSGSLENQKLEELPLSYLVKETKAKGKAAKIINSCLSENSTLAMFWSQWSIQVWDVGTSPPTVVKNISPDSTCILAAVAKNHAAYIIGTRDQKLTLRIVNLTQSTVPVEYRMPSSPWCKSIAIDRNENYVVVGFEESTVRFFKTTNMEHPREDRLHNQLHQDCRRCPSVDTLSFSHDGLALIGSTRSPKSGIIQLYLWRFPFLSFHELSSCRYPVPLHESEDNGISAAVVQSGSENANSMICITTWTQSGTPVLVHPRGGHRSPIQSEISGKQGRIGNRVQSAAFSPTGKELALVNDKGHLYQISHLNSSPLDIRKLAASKELTAKSNSFSMSFMTLGDEEAIVLAWADSSKLTGWVKKIPIAPRNKSSEVETVGMVYDLESRPAASALREIQREPAELSADHVVRELDATSTGLQEESEGPTHVMGFSQKG